VYGSGDEVNAAVEKVLREEWDKTAAAILKGTGIGGGDKASMADLVGYLRQIATNTGAGTEVKIDGNPVAKSVKNAPSNRTAVKR
jgi:hypothetical protein